MNSFNLGCIKGTKGNTGPKGDKGDTGPAGERGADGCTPVFTVAEVQTVDSSSDAGVEIDVTDPCNPKLHFQIPRGADGKDGSGDMNADIYDTEKRKEDFYSYAKTLYGNTLSKTGGSLIGKLVAYACSPQEKCVRNIIFADELPNVAAEGDICFLQKNSSFKNISEQSVGSTLLLKEGDTLAEYILADKDYHADGTVTLIRKYLLDGDMYYDYKVRPTYICSDIDMFLEGTFLQLFSGKTRNAVTPVKINSHYMRHCFLPSLQELVGMQYFKTSSTVATTSGGYERSYYMTRAIGYSTDVYAIDTRGESVLLTQNTLMSIRPVIVLNGNLAVENVLNDGAAAVKVVEQDTGIFFYEGDQWKEMTL